MGLFVSKPIPPKKAWNPFTGEVTDLAPAFVELNNILERLKTIGDDEEWWLDLRTGGSPSRWHKLTEDRIKRYWYTLRQVYDNRWCRSLCSKGRRPGSDPYTLLGMVQSPLTVIMRLGECLTLLGDANKLTSELIKRLKNPREYPNALLELEIATCFEQAGLLQEMYPKTLEQITSTGKVRQPRPEGLVRVGDTGIYYEFIHASWTKAEREGMRARVKLSN